MTVKYRLLSALLHFICEPTYPVCGLNPTWTQQTPLPLALIFVLFFCSPPLSLSELFILFLLPLFVKIILVGEARPFHFTLVQFYTTSSANRPASLRPSPIQKPLQKTSLSFYVFCFMKYKKKRLQASLSEIKTSLALAKAVALNIL